MAYCDWANRPEHILDIKKMGGEVQFDITNSPIQKLC